MITFVETTATRFNAKSERILMCSYILGALTILGLYLVGQKNKYGFLVTFFSEFLWAYWISITPGAKGLYIVCVVVAIISLKNYISWGKDEKEIQKAK